MTIGGILFFILALALIITIHELGHLLTAKMFGVYCHEFSIGMGPKLFTFFRDKSGTEYNLRAIPIGGFVQIAGEDSEADNQKALKEEQILSNIKPWKQIVVLFAGTFSNIILALVLIIIAANISLAGTHGFIEATRLGFVQFGQMWVQFFDGLKSLFSPDGLNNISGIIGIADLSNQISNQGIIIQLIFVAMLSLNIGIINQLPIPMLDGGRILMVLYSAITKRPITRRTEEILMYISLAIIGLIFVYSTFADITRIFN